MPDEKKRPDQKAEVLAISLLGTCSQVGITNSLQRSLTGKFRVVGIVTRENGEPVSGISLGLMGQECRTDAEGKFELLIEKKQSKTLSESIVLHTVSFKQ
jgi:hypothetical protein